MEMFTQTTHKHISTTDVWRYQGLLGKVSSQEKQEFEKKKADCILCRAKHAVFLNQRSGIGLGGVSLPEFPE